VRALPQVKEATFDIPSESFTITLHEGDGITAVLNAIQRLGFDPKLLDDIPAPTAAITRLDTPTSTTLREGLARATARGVPLVVAFGGPFCSLCKKFEEHTLRDARVLLRLERLESLQIDVEADPDAARDLDVHGVPDLWVLDGTGSVLARHNGFLDTDAFLALLDRVAKR